MGENVFRDDDSTNQKHLISAAKQSSAISFQLPALLVRLRDPLTTTWIVFFLALLVRLAIVAGGYHGEALDTPEYDEIALNLLAGKGFVASRWWSGFEIWSWRPPFYSFFLAAIYAVFGYDQMPVRIVQCIIGAVTCVLVMKLAHKLDARIAPLCAGLAIIYGPLAVMSNQLMTEIWFTFWLVLAVYWLTPPASVRSFVGAGFATGMSVLTRPMGVAVGLALLLMAFVRRTPWNFRSVLWTGIAALITLFPWTVRNCAVHGVWPMLSTQGGYVLERSNTFDPQWRKIGGWQVPREILEKIPSEVERDRYWTRKAIQFVREHPAVYFRLVPEKFLHLWYFFRPEYNFWFMLILPFFVLGFYRDWSTEGYLLPSLLILVSTVLFSLVLYGNSRFRWPLEPFFLIFACSAIRHLYETRGGKWTLGLIVLAASLNLLIAWQEVAIRAGLLDLLHLVSLK